MYFSLIFQCAIYYNINNLGGRYSITYITKYRVSVKLIITLHEFELSPINTINLICK